MNNLSEETPLADARIAGTELDPNPTDGGRNRYELVSETASGPFTLEEVRSLLTAISRLLEMSQRVSRALARGSVADAQDALREGVERASEALAARKV